jgi:biopolymer transport protein ExbB/TolQ/uncharacterized protein YukE
MSTGGSRRAIRAAHKVGVLSYPTTLSLLLLAFAFPFALMAFDPELMFQRGWEQYVGTAIYLWAVATLGIELIRLWRNERALRDAGTLLAAPGGIDPSDRRVLPSRLRHLGSHAQGGVAVAQLMELNRESSALDQEHAHGRLTLTRYILYLLPVIGFIGTVEGISKALMNISKVLPLVKELDGFLANLTGVTAALQIAFDSTLLALFLSAALMLVQTLVIRRGDDLLARVDGWVVEQVLPELAAARQSREVADPFDALRAELAQHAAVTAATIRELTQRLDVGLAGHIDRFSSAVDRLPSAFASLERGASALVPFAANIQGIAELADSARKGAAALARIESSLAGATEPDPSLDAIKRGVDRAGTAIEALSEKWAAAFEKSSRATQDQLAKTLGNLKDALELLHVSIDQGNTLYRSIVKKLVPYPSLSDEKAA